jgi:hypothetical protein
MQDRMLSLTAGHNLHVPMPVDPGALTAIDTSVAAWRPPARDETDGRSGRRAAPALLPARLTAAVAAA